MRHRPHVSAALTRAEERRDRSIADQMRELLDRCVKHLELAEKSHKVRDMAVTSREVRETMKVLAQLTGELDERTRVSVMIAQREREEAGQVFDLGRLDLEERIQLARLLAKVRGDDAPEADAYAIEATSTPADPPQLEGDDQ